MLVNNKGVGMPLARVIVRVTVWFRTLAALVLMLVMRPVRVQVQMLLRFVNMLELIGS